MSGKDHFEKEPFDPDIHEAFKRAVASRGSRPSIPNDAGIEAPEEIAERGRAMFRRALMQADADDLQEDLRQMLEALGMSAHARPYSPHRVFQEALNEMKQQLAAVPHSAASSVEPVAETDDQLAEQIHRVAGCQVGSDRTRKIIEWYRGKSASLTTSPEPDAVREALADADWLKAWTKRTGHTMKPGPKRDAMMADARWAASVALAALSRPAHGGWEDISTAPKDGTPVLIAERSLLRNGEHHWYIDVAVNSYEVDVRCRDAWLERDGDTVVCDEPSHWMPLPKVPTIARNDRQNGGAALMSDRNIFAYTAPGADYPDYLSINRIDGEIVVTVRSDRGSNLAQINLPQSQLDRLIYGLKTARINPLRGSSAQ